MALYVVIRQSVVENLHYVRPSIIDLDDDVAAPYVEAGDLEAYRSGTQVPESFPAPDPEPDSPEDPAVESPTVPTPNPEPDQEPPVEPVQPPEPEAPTDPDPDPETPADPPVVKAVKRTRGGARAED